jgi:prepilin-type N-terminal cleavage/methylation domain-containing protein
VRNQRGFTLIELMVVVLIIGILVSISIVKYSSVQGRAKESSTKANMHTFQLAAEDQCIQSNARYAPAAMVAGNLPAAFANPFDNSTGNGNSWEARATAAGAPSARSGLVSYWTDTLTYNVKGYGRSATLPLVLTPGP